jgi:hypothetical protein
MFLGVSYIIWGIVCLLVAGVYCVFFPSRKDASSKSSGARYFVLRWFHSLVWLLLAVSCFMWGELLPGGTIAAKIISLIALMAYLIFILTFVITRIEPRGNG